MSVLWTYWLGSRLHRDSKISLHGFNSLTNKLTHENLDKDDVLQKNRNSSQENGFAIKRENSLWHNVSYFVTRSKVTLQMTDRVLLQRLQEVSIYLPYRSIKLINYCA